MTRPVRPRPANSPSSPLPFASRPLLGSATAALLAAVQLHLPVGSTIAVAFSCATPAWAQEAGTPAASTDQPATDTSADPAGDTAELVQLVVNLINEADKDLRALGFDQVRTEVPGAAATRQFAELLPGMAADAQVGLLSALADRGDAAARDAAVKLLDGTQDEAVRIAATQALGALGNPTDATRLVQQLSGKSAAEQTATRAALVRLAGDATSREIIALVPAQPVPARVTLLEILATRRAFNTVPELLGLAVDNEPQVRAAAMTTLGQLASVEHMPGLVAGVLKAARGPERDAAEKAVMLVCQRVEPADARADSLLVAIRKLPEADRPQLLSTLGRVGGPAARTAVEEALAAPKTHEAAVRGLANWPDASIAPRLIELVPSDAHPEHRRLLLKALLRVSVLGNDSRTDAQRLELLQQALGMSTRDDERTFALQRARAVRTVDSLRFLLPYLDQPLFAETAAESIVELAHHRGLREAHKPEFMAALDRVLATSKNEVVRDRAERYQRNQTWTRGSTPAQP